MVKETAKKSMGRVNKPKGKVSAKHEKQTPYKLKTPDKLEIEAIYLKIRQLQEK